MCPTHTFVIATLVNIYFVDFITDIIRCPFRDLVGREGASEVARIIWACCVSETREDKMSMYEFVFGSQRMCTVYVRLFHPLCRGYAHCLLTTLKVIDSGYPFRGNHKANSSSILCRSIALSLLRFNNCDPCYNAV